jgi:hypothetical protein
VEEEAAEGREEDVEVCAIEVWEVFRGVDEGCVLRGVGAVVNEGAKQSN